MVIPSNSMEPSNEETPAEPWANIHTAIIRIIRDLPHIGKDSGGNSDLPYRFRGIDDILPHVKAQMVRHGVVVQPFHRVRSDESYKTGGGTVMRRVTTDSMFLFIAAADGSTFGVQTIGEAADSSDKASNKAMTAALKYAYIEVFQIGGSEDPDHQRPELESFDTASTERPAAAAPEPTFTKGSNPNWEELRDLGEELHEMGVDIALRAWVSDQGIDMKPGRDEEGVGRVVAKAKELLTAAHAAIADQPADDTPEGDPEPEPEGDDTKDDAK